MTHRLFLLLLLPILVIPTGVSTPAADKPGADAPIPFVLPPGFTAELVAAPPLVNHPMHVCFDDRGRLLVADSLGINPTKEQMGPKPAMLIRLLEDSDGDGRFDKSTIFADNIVFPEGVQWHRGAVFTASPPSLWRLDDPQGLGRAGKRQELVTGFWHKFGIADDLHGPTLGPDGRLYWGCGRFQHEIRRPGGPILWKGRAPLILRCRPDGSDVEVVSGAHGNPVKVAFTPEGEPFACGTWGKGEGGRQDLIIHCVEGGNYPQLDGDFFSPEFKNTGDILPPMVWFGPASASGMIRHRSGAFGAEYRDNLFAALFNMHKVTRHVVERDGATFRARTEDFLFSKDPNFRPSDVLEDADGSLLVVNTGTWSNCCQAYRAGGQPKVEGNIYRIRRTGAPRPLDPHGLAIAWVKQTPAELVGLLDDPRFMVRDRAVDEFGFRPSAIGNRPDNRGPTADVKALQETLISGASVRARRNALWALNRVEGKEAMAAIRRALADKDESLRLTATRIVGLQRDLEAVPPLLELVRNGPAPIRREAATTLGRLRQAEAVPALLESLKLGGDRFLEHALVYALIQIGDRPATLQGLADANPASRRGALVALAQMDGGNLTPELVTPLLNTDDPALQKTALTLLSSRPGWSREVVGLLRTWLVQKEVPADRQESLRGAVLASCQDPAIQELVAQTLQKKETPLTTRLLLLETMARAPLTRLPDVWVQELGAGLEHADERVVRQAVTALHAGRVGKFDAALLGLAGAEKRPAELRIAALAAAEARLVKLDTALFTFLVAQLDAEVPPLTRLAAADCLGSAPLDDRQLESLAEILARVGPLEMPRLVAVYERSKSPAVGTKLLSALGRASVLSSLAPDTLSRTLRHYPPAVQEAARPLFARLQADEAQQLVRLKELEPVLGGGNVKRGREIFFGKKAACFACHAVRGEGGQVGPDLSQIGAIRSGRDLLVAVAFPSASFARGFEPYVVATRAGRFYPSGLLRRETADAIYLVTGDRAELRIPRAEVETITPSRVSIMPDGFDRQLTQQELTDLLAFVQALK